MLENGMARRYLGLQRGGPFTLSYLALLVRFSELRNPSHACHMFHPSCRPLIVKASLCNQPSDRQSWILLVQNRVCDSVLPGQCYSTFQRAVDGWLWISGGMMISRGKQKKIVEKLAPVPFRPPRIWYEITRYWTKYLWFYSPELWLTLAFIWPQY